MLPATSECKLSRRKRAGPKCDAISEPIDSTSVGAPRALCDITGSCMDKPQMVPLEQPYEYLTKTRETCMRGGRRGAAGGGSGATKPKPGNQLSPDLTLCFPNRDKLRGGINVSKRRRPSRSIYVY